MTKQISFRGFSMSIVRLVFASLMLVVASCGKDDSPTSESGFVLSISQLQGTWRFDEVTVSTPILNPLRDDLLGATVRYCCQNRATLTLANNGGEDVGTFRISGNKIRFDSGYFDEQEMQVQEISASSKRATMAFTSDDDGSIRVIGRATFRLSKISDQ